MGAGDVPRETVEAEYQRRRDWARPISEQVAVLRHDVIALRTVVDAHTDLIAMAARSRERLEGMMHGLVGNPDIREDTGQVGELRAQLHALRAQAWAVIVLLVTVTATLVAGLVRH